MGICLGPYGCPRRGAVSYERGTPVGSYVGSFSYEGVTPVQGGGRESPPVGRDAREKGDFIEYWEGTTKLSPHQRGRVVREGHPFPGATHPYLSPEDVRSDLCSQPLEASGP